MASSQIPPFNITLITIFAFPLLLVADNDIPMPNFAFSWLDDKDTYVAGDIATIKVKVLGNFEIHKYNHSFCPNITVNDKMGNSSLISGVSSLFDEGDYDKWRISFVPIMIGLFNLLITDDNFHVFDSSMHFRVTPGKIYPSAGIVSWMGDANYFVAGDVATILILPKDAFGNNVSASSEGDVYTFNVSASFANGSIASVLNVTNKGWDGYGYLHIEFIAVTAGSLLLHVEEGNQTLSGSPLLFEVVPGILDVPSCVSRWRSETSSFQLFSTMETHIHQRDKYGNLVSGLYAFDVEVVEKGTNLSMPVADLRFEEVVPGIQLCSFSLVEPGNFMLMISDKEQNDFISHVPYDFTVYIGYCSGVESIINGSGLNSSVAGEVSRFFVFLRDAYQYPSPVELESFQVRILRELDEVYVQPSISPMEFVNGSLMAHKPIFGTSNLFMTAFAPTVHSNNDSAGNLKPRASEVEVTYKPEKTGIYEISLFCGNIQLSSGNPIKKEVSAGEVNTSMSGVVKFSPKVPMLINNEIIVRLIDSFSNPVLLQQSKLKLEIGSINGSKFSTSLFIDNKDGSYSGTYLANDVGTYEICASFDGKHFSPCPFGVNVYRSEYFPKAKNDLVSVWEDESIAFSTLDNDYFAGHNASVVEFSKPNHGSLLQYGHLFRYTPYKGFYGNDSFTYTISDVNGNIASASVNISVLSIPPQFVSFPSQLQTTEDMSSPTFGGFPGFEIIYSDLLEIISVTLGARFGTVTLSPMVMQFWQSMWNEFTLSKGNEKDKQIVIEGRLEVINFVLLSIQYLGDENFYGEDAIRVSTMNQNGINGIEVPIFVEPINDPPFINIPEFIILDEKRDEEELLIFDRQRDKFNFSVGDPDLLSTENGSRFLVMFSLEVNSGAISTNLPSELISTTELKLKSSYHWQPLQTFITISKHFTVKAKGIRFRGTIDECNSVMQQLAYHGNVEDGAVLTVEVNDMGKYGCFPDCAEMMSKPLSAKATTNLIRRWPMSSSVAHTLGSAIVIEFVALISLGVVLLLFVCRCALVLIRERKRSQNDQVQNIELSSIHDSPNKTFCTGLSENVSYLAGWCSRPFLFSGQPPTFSQRSGRRPVNAKSSKGSQTYLQFSSDNNRETA